MSNEIENLLNIKSSTFETKEGSLVSFKDCPNHCIDGYIINPYSHKKVICDYCMNKRRVSLRDGLKSASDKKSISEILKLPSSFSGVSYDVDTIIPDSVKNTLVQSSYENVINELKSLLSLVKGGATPNHSYLFNLGKKVYEGNYIYTLISNAYISGLSTAPLLTAFDVVNLRLLAEKGLIDLELNLGFNDILKKEIVVVDIEAGATMNSILSVKGLMQLRALKGLPTIIFTNQWGNIIQDLCNDYPTLNLATLYSVEYKEVKSVKERDNSFNGIQLTANGTASMTTEQFKNLFSNS